MQTVASKSKLFQTGTISSLITGVYDGELDFKRLLTHGDTGLGTFNGVDGELIIVDGVCYRVNDKGVVNRVDITEKTPFTTLGHFESQQKKHLSSIANWHAMETAIGKQLPSQNCIYLLKISGAFGYIKLRSEACQQKPYRPMIETMPDLERHFELTNTEGVIVATWFPESMSNLNVPGFHLHYLDDAKTTGGHVYDLSITAAELEICPIRELQIDFLLNSPDFLNADLTADSLEHIKQLENPNLS